MKRFDDFDEATQESHEPQSMSLMGGIAGGGAMPGTGVYESDSAGESRKVAQQSFFIGAIVTVVALGALLGMRLTQKDATASTISPETAQFMADLEVRVANFDKMAADDPMNPSNIRELFRDTAAIVAAIENDPTVKQVPVEQVKMNPFTPLAGKEQVAEDSGPSAEEVYKSKLQGYYRELAGVEIQSLVGGQRPRAFIGGELYKVGDKLGSFQITAIDSRSISFEVPGFELKPGDHGFVLGVSVDR